MPMLVLIAYSALFGRNPQILLRQAIAARLRAVSRALRQKNEEGRERLMRSLEGGNAELLKTLGMIKLLRLQPPDTTARLRALLTLSYSLALTVSAFDTAASCLSMKLPSAAFWKLGQAKPTETLRFHVVTVDWAQALRHEIDAACAESSII
jgi:hypothetical protein